MLFSPRSCECSALGRRAFTFGAASLAATAAFGRVCRAVAAPLSGDDLARGRDFLRRHPTIDAHAHPGRFFMAGARTPLTQASPPPDPDGSIQHMKAGAISAVVFAAVSDFLILGANAQGLYASREFAPGEAFADYERQMATLAHLVGEGRVVAGRSAADIVSAHDAGVTACFVSVEGGEFIEDRLDRIQASHDAGVRSITIIHYHTNQIGDPQTVAPVHDGLTLLGRDVVREMNRTGSLVDLAHASMEATRQAVAVSSKPMIISHSNLRLNGLTHPRLISVEHARMVTEAGGILGALPAGAGEATLDDFIDTLFRSVDLLGIDHVAIGTDMDFTFRSVVADYADWATVPAGLLARGMNEMEVAKIMGGNYMRLLAAL